MRSLEEVIMCLEGCGMIDCNDCPYHYEDEKIEVDDCDQAYKDALQWLKIFRDTKVKLEDERQNYRDVTRALRTEHAWQEYRKERQ